MSTTSRQPASEVSTGCIHSLFEAQVCRFGHEPAVICENQSLSYDALNQRANQLAHYLRQRGVGPEVRVGLLLERSLDMVVSVLGVLKAGGAYVPLDPNYPEARLQMIIAEAKANLVLTQEGSRSKLKGVAFGELCLDEQRGAIANCRSDNPDSGVEPENLAYIIYTSGSTGKPKGVMVQHRGLCNMSAAQAHTFLVAPGERVLQFASINFDASIFEITMALTAGATLCVASREAQLSAQVLFKLLRENRITNVTLPPSFLATWQTEELPDLKTIIVAGEACSAKVVANWAPGRRFFNAYGPTEATVWTSVARCIDAQVKPIIGRSIENTEIHILDANLEPVVTNALGDLYIAGVSLARGYFQSPGLTADKFIPNPFAQLPGERLYRTGDLARLLPDGQIDFVGRSDQQIKLRGFRIELGDIEAALMQHPSVQETVVVLDERQPDEARLVGYVVLKSLPKISGSDLRSFLKTRLPDYMVPSVFVEMTSLPTTPNGKIDRRALPAVAAIRTDLEESFVAARNPLEEIVAGVWCHLLGLDRVGIHDDLFALGAHSLMLTRAAARLRDQFNVEIPLRCFFDSPTVAHLAAALETNLAAAQQFDLKPIKPVPRNSDLPLSFAQERVLFLHQLYGPNKAYNAQVSLSFRGNLQVEALERSLAELVRRHEILRTTFTAKDGQPFQLIHEPEERKLQLIDLSSLPSEVREQRLKQLMRDEMDRTFSLDKLPLIRWALFRLTPEEHVLLQVEHHFLHDGWSFSVLLKELFQIYTAFTRGLPSPLAEPAIQFADFAVWQREFMEGAAAQSQLAYWKGKLTGAPALLSLPTDSPRPPVPSFRGNVLRLELPASLSRSVRELSHRSGCTLFMTMFACFAALLHRYTNQEDFCIGTGLANRRWKETEGILGMIINTVALRADLSGDPSFAELLRRVREVTVDAYANQDLPFDRVIEAIQPARSLSYSPLYQVTFSFHDAPIVDVELPDLDVKILEALSNESAKFDLNVVVIPDAGQRYRHRKDEESGMIMIWEYNTDLFRAGTIEQLSSHYQNLLASVVSEPQRAISELRVLSEQEEHQLLSELNETARKYQPARCVHELFADQVARTPDAPAIADDVQQWSYQELDWRSNQLANHLRSLGIGPESRVAILLDRSCEFVLAALAAIKAGAAYVPLDSQHPAERILFMLRDVGATAVVSSEHLAREIGSTGARLVLLNREQARDSVEATTPLPVNVTPDNVAYIIYTSGSTGHPKGVAVTHGGLLNLVRWHQETYNVSNRDRASQVAGQSFDASVWEIWPYLTAGASLHVAPPAVVTTPPLLVAWLVKNEISIGFLPTPLAEAVLDETWPDTCALRYLLTGGDRLHAVGAGQRPFVLANHYGPTEYSVVATSRTVNGSEPAPPIGRPIANTEVYVLDRKMKPVPVGVAGELYLSGAGLARCYWQQPALTAEQFVPNPFSRNEGSRLYRTGDLVRYLPNFELEFLGRIDSQVKVRGYRIELGEIETVLRRHASVREAVVDLKKRDDGETLLVGYVVFAAEHSDQELADLRNYLRGQLPEYMVPHRFIVLPELPLNSSGKVNRAALPDAAEETAPTFIAPRNEDEELVAKIWAEVLGVSKVGVEDNFFALGGHSLLATRILARVSKALQVDIPLDSLFRGGTIASLVEVAQRKKASSPAQLSILPRAQSARNVIGR